MSATFIPVIKFYRSPRVLPVPVTIASSCASDENSEDNRNQEIVDINSDDDSPEEDSDDENVDISSDVDDELNDISRDEDSEEGINDDNETRSSIIRFRNVEILVRRLDFVKTSRFLVKTIFRKKPTVRIKNLRLFVSTKEAGNCVNTILEVPLELTSDGENVIFFEDSEIPFISDIFPARKSQVSRLDNCLTFLKPSQSEENYGLGSKSEMEKDDVDCPRKAIPFWAQNENLTELLHNQQDIDCDRIFDPCESPDLKTIFSGSKRIFLETPQPIEKTKKRKVNFEDCDTENNPVKKSRNLLHAFCS